MKRTISMILVAAFAVLSLVSCGYSIANEDISSYAALSQEDKAKFEAALKELKIEDGDFTTDPDTRDAKVWDALYTALASKASEDDKVSTGTPGAHDVVYYSYYCTAKFGEETVTLYTSSMKTPAKVQLGLKDPTDLQEKLSAKLNVDFTDKAYKANEDATATAKKDDVAFVTYTYTYRPEGATADSVTTVTSGIVVVGDAASEGAAASSFESYLNGKKINTTLDNVEIADATLGTVKYSNIKINWIAEGAKLAEIKDTTYDATTTVKDTNGKERDLKDVELTYHVYPVGFVAVPEYSATSLMNDIIGTDLNEAVFYEIAFGRDFVGSGDEANKYTEEKKNEILGKYTNISYAESGETKTAKTLADLISAIANAQTAVASAEDTLDKAQDAYDKKVAAAGAEGATSEKTAVDNATAALNTALENRMYKLAALFALDNGAMEATIAEGYKTSTKLYLEDNYENEIKMNLAKEVYALLKANVKVTNYPEEAIDETYDQLIENYEYKFYNEDDESSKKSNYQLYEKSFKKYLVAVLSAELGTTIANYDEAKTALREKAKTYVEPILVIYAAAEAYGVVVTDEEYEAYKDKLGAAYTNNLSAYGENSFRYACQFDKLMNHFVKDGTVTPGEDGKVVYNSYITYTATAPSKSGSSDGHEGHNH